MKAYVLKVVVIVDDDDETYKDHQITESVDKYGCNDPFFAAQALHTQVRLTSTVEIEFSDNPYDPHNQNEAWWQYEEKWAAKAKEEADRLFEK